MDDIKDWINQDPETAFTLPSKYFYAGDIFELEKQNIFMKSWHVVGHKNELKEPGQYIVTEIFDQSVITAKGRDGEVHAFFNVCQHRGNKLIEERRGNTKLVFSCPYHSWSYDMDGKLRSAPRSENIKRFDKNDFNIPKVRIEELGGFYYLNLDPNAPSLAELFPGADTAMRNAFPDLDDLQLIEEQDVVVNANWKVIMDNSIEGYHFTLSGPGHIELGDLIDFSGYKLIQYENWWTYGAPSDLSVTEPYGVKLDEPARSDDCFFNIGLWPNNTFYQFPFSNFLGTFIMIPLEPEKSLLRFGYYSPRKTLQEVTKASIKWMNECLGPEDISLNLSTQKGLRSMGYDQGRYMIDAERSNESEHLLHHFHTLVWKGLHQQC